MYKTEDLRYGITTDSKTENYDNVLCAYLDHSCGSWVIGGPDEIRNLIADLRAILSKITYQEQIP